MSYVPFVFLTLLHVGSADASLAAARVVPCVDLLTVRLERAGRLKFLAVRAGEGHEPMEVNVRPQVIRATSRATVHASLDVICDHLERMKSAYVVIGANPRSNVPGVAAELRLTPWTGYAALGSQLVRLIDRIDGPWALLMDLVDEDLNTLSPELERFWFHVRRMAEHRAAVRPSNVNLFATYADLSSPRGGRITEIRDRTGWRLSLLLNDLTDERGEPRL